MVFGFGAALAGLAGLLAGPIHVVQPGMGELILIEVFVVIVIGGIGSIRGALAGALIVGMVDTLGRAFLKPALADGALADRGRRGGPRARVDAHLSLDGGRCPRLKAAGPLSGPAVKSSARTVAFVAGLLLLAAVPPVASLFNSLSTSISSAAS